jgi:vacuolar protein sorting-associated protein 33A
MLLQQRHGLFPRITGKGDNARRLADLLIRMRSEVAAGEESIAGGPSSLGLTPSSTIESLIIIDREVDFGTVLLTQLTYEGLIDEVVGIQNSQADVDQSIVGAAPNPQAGQGSKTAASTQAPQHGKKRKIPLDSSDKLYAELRDMNFAIVGPTLNRVARRLEADFERRHTMKSIPEIRDFTAKLPGLMAEQNSAKIHTNLTEEIMKFTKSDLFNSTLMVQQTIAAGNDPSTMHPNIEELIARASPLPTVLRLLCLESVVGGGLKPKDLDFFKREILHAYGFQHILTLDALEKLQLLQSRTAVQALTPHTATGGGGRNNYNYLRKTLRLIDDEINEQDPNDVAYVYSGYAPLSIRLVQCVLQKPFIASLQKSTIPGVSAIGAGTNTTTAASLGWRGFEDILKNVRGATFDEVQRGEDKAVRARSILNGAGDKKTVVVFFLGGVTYAEIAALRYIAQKEDGRRKILIATTSLISGGRMVGSAIVDAGDH